MNDLMIFNNPEFGEVRTLTIDNEPWFVGKDVAEILGYVKPRNAIATHVDDDDKALAPIQGGCSTGTQDTAIINESGLYSLIMSSKLPSAKKFKRWVTSEVLPSIRKTGSYSVKHSTTSKDKSARAEAMLNNSRVRMAKMWLEIGKMNPVPEYKEICTSHASEALAGKPVLPLPEVKERTYTAAEVGQMLGGISANKVGRLANQHNLKTPEFGIQVWDKSRHSNKEVASWRYNDKAVEALRGLLVEG